MVERLDSVLTELSVLRQHNIQLELDREKADSLVQHIRQDTARQLQHEIERRKQLEDQLARVPCRPHPSHASSSQCDACVCHVCVARPCLCGTAMSVWHGHVCLRQKSNMIDGYDRWV